MSISISSKIGIMSVLIPVLISPKAISVAASQIALPVPLAAGTEHSLAVAADGTVWHWGLTMGGYTLQQQQPWTVKPTRIGDLGGVVATAAGEELNLALKADGTVWHISYPRIQQVTGLSGIVAVDVGRDYGLALKADGTVWQLDSSLNPVQVSGLEGIAAVAIAAYESSMPIYGGSLYHAAALKEDGTVWTWTDSSGPEIMKPLLNVVAIAAGFDHLLALKDDGTVWAWGSNTCGQSGASKPTTTANGPDWIARQVEGIGDVTAISAGGGEHFFSFGHSLALRRDGTVWEWGCDGTAHFNPVPTQVAGMTGALAIAAGGEHSLVMKEDGSIWAWGWNYYGQLGDGTRTDSFFDDGVVRTPVQVVGLEALIISYFNEYGRPYTNEEHGFWYNQDERQWYRGTKSTREIVPIPMPPWKEQNAP